MQRKTAIFFIIFPLMLISSCVNAKNKTKGEVLYTNLCASCHGKSGIGNGPVASQLKTKPKDLTKLKQKMGDAFDTKVIKDRIDGRPMPRAHGIPEMPVWGEWFSIQSMSGLIEMTSNLKSLSPLSGLACRKYSAVRIIRLRFADVTVSAPLPCSGFCRNLTSTNTSVLSLRTMRSISPPRKLKFFSTNS